MGQLIYKLLKSYFIRGEAMDLLSREEKIELYYQKAEMRVEKFYNREINF